MADPPKKPEALPELPKEPAKKLVRPLTRFMRVESSSGIVLLLATATALGAANSSYGPAFLEFWKMPVGFSIGEYQVEHKLQHWINDGLMVLFFFVVGLEVKRELVTGELRGIRKAALPGIAAIGGMVVPAGIYIGLQFSGEGAQGWGIPMATDIAFVIGCLALLGSRVPHSLRVMLVSLAIVDDIGAILVIAVGYTSEVHWIALGCGFSGIAFCLLLARISVRSVTAYAIIGVLTWFAFHESGVHATLAGVLLGLITPTKKWISERQAGEIVLAVGRFLSGTTNASTKEKVGALQHARRAGREAIGPAERLETQLHPWVSFGILPLFALANAGVVINWSDFFEPVALAVLLGLVIGKPVGVLLLSWIAVKSGVAKLPQGVSWGMVVSGGMLCGIGFTMAIFIASLAFGDSGDMLKVAKVGILAASLFSAVVGLGMLSYFVRQSSEHQDPNENSTSDSEDRQSSKATDTHFAQDLA